MSKKIRFLFLYIIFFISFFEVARLLFIIFNRNFINDQQVYRSFWYGLRMDVSMTAYLLLPVMVLVLINVLFSTSIQTFIKIYTAIVLFVLSWLIIADIGLFKAWGFRLDATPLKYIGHPKEMWASISHLPVFWICLIMIIIFWLLMKMVNRYVISQIAKLHFDKWNKWLQSLCIILMSGALIIPLRGGIQLAPLNQSSVYFSTDNFSNQSALNPVWNLMYSLNHNVESTTNPFIIAPDEEGANVVDSLYKSRNSILQLVDLQKTPHPNIIMVVWESFTKKIIDQKRNGIEITPCYNRLKNEGVYFPGLYASGDRTDKGIVAVLSGYPAQPITSIVKTPAKAAHLPMLSKVLAKENYHTSFYYGGEPEFANMKAYLLQGGFKNFITIDDFPKANQNSKWGAHDDVVMKKLFSDLQKMPQPFFTTWLTLSSHEPFETPVNTVIPGTDDENMFLNAMHYSDSTINDFIVKCTTQSWWNNTILIIIPDHGSRLPVVKNKKDDFTISVLMLGGALQQHPIVINRTGSQIDLPATLLAQLGKSSSAFTWSKNLLDTTAMEWGYFAFNNGFGFAEPNRGVVFDNTGNMIIEKWGNVTPDLLRTGRLMQQMTFKDYLNR